MKLNKVEGKSQFHVEVSNMFATLEYLDTVVDINSAWETIRISQYQPKRVFIRFEVFMAVTMKNAVSWDVTPSGSCKNRHFGGT
jgi:hypothetical protein